MRYCEVFSAKVINEDFLQPAEGISHVKQSSCRLIDARVEDDFVLSALKLSTTDDELTVHNLGGQQLFQGHHLALIVLFDVLRQFKDYQTRIDLVNVLV